MTQRRGFTLVEVLIALVIMGLVTGAVYQLLTTNQRLSLAQAEQVNLQSTVRTGSLIVPNELRELNNWAGSVDATQIDVIDADADAIEYRAMRGIGVVCQVAANELRLLSSSWNGPRLPDATRDGLYLFVDGDPDEDGDDAWEQVDITAVAPNSNCGAAGAIALTVAPVPPAAAISAVSAGAPVRLYEVMRLELDQDAAGEWWLGARSVSAGEITLQPVLGPLTNDGFELAYLDGAGNPTAALDAIASIRVTMRGLTDGAVRAHGTAALGHPTDSMATQVLLRNSIRP